MASPLYNSRGTWSATVPYNYLDAVQYGKFTYICTLGEGSLNQRPDQSGLVWVQMPVIIQEDQYYLRDRESLLQYEDARYQSLINAMANFYTMRNDQSIWGAFLRAIAIELARIEYMYSYDVVAKNPQYLTPPDIKRQYANPLFVSGNFQQLAQFDSGDFGAPFGQWTTDTGVILRTAILDSNGNVQIAITAGATGIPEPSWALEVDETTTTDGNVVWLNAGPPPATLAYPIGYRDMLVDLLAAYQEGATPKSIQDVIYAYTGKNIVVEELYKEISSGFYDQSDRNAIKVSVNVGGSDPLVDIESLTELQQITNSLYGAIDLAKPAHVGLEFTTIFGSDENIDCFISPRYLTQYQMSTLTAKQKQYYTLIAYVLTQLTVTGWKADTSVTAGSIIQDSNGNIQLCTVPGVTADTAPTWSTVLQGITNEVSTQSPPLPVTWVTIVAPQPWNSTTNYSAGDVATVVSNGVKSFYLSLTGNTNQNPQNSINSETWSGVTQPGYLEQYGYLDSAQYHNGLYPIGSSSLNGVGTAYWSPLPLDTTPQISIAVYTALPTPQQQYFQGFYQNLNCVGTGIEDTLQIIIQQYEEPPFDPMLYQAPIFDISQAPSNVLPGQTYPKGKEYSFNNPSTTLASYGRRILSPISATNWTALQSAPQVWSSTVTYPKGTLVRGVSALTSGSFDAGTWTPGGWQLYRALKKNTNQAVSNATYWTPLASPSTYQAYYRTPNGQYAVGIKQWSPASYFYVGQLAIDNAGNMQLAVSTSGAGTSAPVANVSTLVSSVVISNNVLTLKLSGGGTTAMGLVPDVSTVTILGFSYAKFLNGLTLQVLPDSPPNPNVLMLSYTHDDYDSLTNNESNATVQIGFSTSASVPTYDGFVLWQYLGANYLTNPLKWIQVVDSTNSVTGEVANYSILHPMGLLAPRTDLCWELSGDFFNSYEYE